MEAREVKLTTAEYEAFTDTTDLGHPAWYLGLGVVGEAGEVADKIKKLYRDKGYQNPEDLTPEDRKQLMREIGDNIWYLTRITRVVCKSTLLEIMAENIAKLEDRVRRDKIHGAGDNR